MDDPEPRPASADLAYAGLRCPHCEYDLTGAAEPRCPECGEAFDPAKLPAHIQPTWWRGRASWWAILLCVLLAVYLPNTWVFWIDYPWSGGYRMYWVMLFPVLPSLVVLAWGLWLVGLKNNLDGALGLLVMGAFTAALIAAGWFAGRRSRLWLIVFCIVMFVLQVFNALVCFALFRA